MLTLKELEGVKEVEDILKELDAVFPDDKVLVVLNEMELESKALRFDEEKVHRLFYHFSCDNPDVFKEFVFKTTGTYPYSRLLERVIQRLKISRVLKTENPDYERVRLAEGTSDYVHEEIISRLNQKDYDILKKLGQELNKEAQK